MYFVSDRLTSSDHVIPASLPIYFVTESVVCSLRSPLFAIPLHYIFQKTILFCHVESFALLDRLERNESFMFLFSFISHGSAEAGPKTVENFICAFVRLTHVDIRRYGLRSPKAHMEKKKRISEQSNKNNGDVNAANQ